MRGAARLVCRRVTRSALLALVLSIVIPGAVASAKRPAVVPAKTPAVPSCASLSRTATAQVARTGPLTLGSHIGNGCVFDAPPSGEYQHIVSIQIEPYSYPTWHLEEAIAKNHVSPPGTRYHYISPLDYQSTKSFHLLASFGSVTNVTSQGMPPCTSADNQTPPTPPSQELGPSCAPQPDEYSYLATGDGYYKSSPLQLMVVAVETGLPSTAAGSYVTALVTGILTGSIH